jgi:hypothetical protein
MIIPVKCREIQLPAVGTAGGFGGKKDKTFIIPLIHNARTLCSSAVYEKKVDFKSDD